MRHLSRACAIAVLLAGPVESAQAQPSTASAEADTLFEQARSLMDAHKFGEACAAFEASQKISPAISTLLNLAHCREQNHELATAYGLFRDAERQTRAPLDDSTQALNRTASNRAKALAPRLSKLTIAVPAASRVEGLVVTRGATVVEPGAWNHELPVDGGSFVIAARAPGYLDWSGTVEIAVEGDTRTVEVPALVRAPVAVKPIPRSRAIILPIAIASGAVVLIGGAVGLDALARSEYDDARFEPDNAKQTSLWRGAQTKRYVAQGAAVAGVAMAAGAVWLYLRRGREAAEPRLATLEVLPVVDAGGGGLVVGGSF